jgi:hypothetical protein
MLPARAQNPIRSPPLTLIAARKVFFEFESSCADVDPTTSY